MSQGEADTTSARFVVQRHDARSPHYDFRLENDGVFKSWAIPKHPPLVAGERRLAMMTQDHELTFGGFEARIPDGEYGAGTITIWDQGLFSHEGNPAEQLARGGLRFTLQGRRLAGRFRLIKPRHHKWRKTTSEWLLINDGTP